MNRTNKYNPLYYGELFTKLAKFKFSLTKGSTLHVIFYVLGESCI